MSHTEGKLRVYFADSLRAWPGIDNGASKIVVYADVRGHRRSGVGGDTEEEVQANARRLVACWNACDGNSTEELEDGAIQKLREQRDKLLSVAKTAERLVEIANEQVKCQAERVRLGWRAAGIDGRVGIAVNSDFDALRWQALERERRSLITALQSAIAKAEGKPC